MKVRINVFLEPEVEKNEGFGSMQIYQTVDLGPWTWQQLGEVLPRLDNIAEYLEPTS